MSWSSFWNDYYENGIIPNIWKGITGQKSADRNADKNIEYQKDRNEIEDERYEEETEYNRQFAEEQRDYQREFEEEQRDYNRAFQENERDYSRAFAQEQQNYNRAFAEEQRDYERALQQQVFEREDTAIERQASQLSKLGINPITQKMSGLGSGSLVSSAGAPAGSSPVALSPSSQGLSSASLPPMSSRGGKALNRAMQKFGSLSEFLGSFESILRPLQDIYQSVQDYNTGNLTRDALALENDRKYFENFKTAHDLGMYYQGPATDINKTYRGKKMSPRAINGGKVSDLPEYRGSLGNAYFTNDTAKNLNMFSQNGFDGIIERSLTKGAKLVEDAHKTFTGSDKKLEFNLFDFLKNFIH